MDAETARLAASNLVSGVLKTGDSAPEFILADAHSDVLGHSQPRSGFWPEIPEMGLEWERF
jgi:hypothetical protein